VKELLPIVLGSSGGVRNERFTEELESFKPAGAKPD
jgi:hypothetical protein